MKPVIIVTGPTASGKSGFSVELAKKIDAEIISSDASQVYKEMNIGTAKISDKEKQNIMHHLIDVCNPNEDYSVKNFQTDSRKIIDSIHSKNKNVIISGGTGLYINAAIYPYKFEDEDNEKLSIRETIENIYLKYGFEYLLSLYRIVDPYGYKKVDICNPIRVKRAFEYFILHQKSKFLSNSDDLYKSLFNSIVFVLNWPREELYNRINSRVDLMIKDGLIEEVKNLIDKYPNYDKYQSFKAIGYKEVILYLNGEISYDFMVDLIKKNSRNYAKRQITWFRKDPNAIWININKNSNQEEILADMIRQINLK